MSYASPLETRIAKRVTKAITDYRLVEDGDRVMVGLSGGKDSWALIRILDVLRQRAPITFSLIGVTVDSGYDGYRHDLIASTCEARITHTCRSGTNDSARRPCPGPASSTIVPVSAIGVALNTAARRGHITKCAPGTYTITTEQALTTPTNP